jgi:hypothetical protein
MHGKDMFTTQLYVFKIVRDDNLLFRKHIFSLVMYKKNPYRGSFKLKCHMRDIVTQIEPPMPEQSNQY